MPNCPYCSIELAFCPEGGFCYSCERLFPPKVVVKMEGYDALEASQVAFLFYLLQGIGALAPGKNTAEFLDDGIIVHPTEE